MNTQLITSEARKAIQIGYQNHWRFRVVGRGDVPKNAYYKDEWVFEPINSPNVAQDRLKALKQKGICFKGFVIAHEAPRLLTMQTPKVPKPDFKNKDILPDLENLVVNVMFGLGYFFSLLFQMVLLDPALIVILEDGTWLEVMTWYE